MGSGTKPGDRCCGSPLSTSRAGLLEGRGRGWLGALRGRLLVLWQCRRGEPRKLQNSTVLQRQGLGTEMALGEMG